MACWYRVEMFGEPKAPWRPTKKQAERDASNLCLGEYDDWGKFYVTAPASIEWVHENNLRRDGAGCHASCTRTPSP